MKAIDEIKQILSTVLDPEVPVLSVVDLGIIHRIAPLGDNYEVDVMPTYSGCPALDEIELNIKSALEDNGFPFVKINRIIDPPWSSDLMTEQGRQKLKDYGIAPPVSHSADKAALYGEERLIPCPQCDSTNTKLVSSFGSTACKALFQCQDCKEPFDYFKCH